MKLHVAARYADVVRHFKEFAELPESYDNPIEALLADDAEVSQLANDKWQITDPYAGFYDLVTTVTATSSPAGGTDLTLDFELRHQYSGEVGAPPPYIRGLNAGVNRVEELSEWASELDAFIAKQLKTRGRELT